LRERVEMPDFKWKKLDFLLTQTNGCPSGGKNLPSKQIAHTGEG